MTRTPRAAFIALCLIVVIGFAVPARAATTYSADGRTATDGTRALGVSAVKDLNPDGEIVTVTGRGYNPNKGIYIAFCVLPPAGQKPSPCGGGEDRDGASGSSIWLSNELTSRAQGSEQFGPNGSFERRLILRANLAPSTVDCRVSRCGVVTRNDHTRGNDRSQDLFIPVTFRATAATTIAGGATTTSAAPPKLPSTTTTTLAPELTAPVTSVDSSGRSVSGGGKTLSADAVSALATDQTLTVRGQGYDPTKGVYISLCAISSTITEPGPCGSGSAGAQAWVSSNPPAFGKSRAMPYSPGGAFEVQITIDPLIDPDHDCRKVACAIATRNDDSHPLDRSQDLILPVTFAAEAEPTTTTSVDVTDVAGASISRNDESSTPYQVALGAMVVGGIVWMVGSRARRRASAS